LVFHPPPNPNSNAKREASRLANALSSDPESAEACPSVKELSIVSANPKEVREYWESRSPGLKHSQEPVGSPAFFAAVEREQYSDPFKYAYLKDVAGFDQHPREKVLEIGVDLGTDILQFARAGSDAYGIDLTTRAVELTSQRLEPEGLTGHFQQASFTELPFEDNSFDVVYSFGVLHHSAETKQGIAEIHRVLKPDGQLMVMLYHKGFKYYVRKLFLYGVLKGELLTSSPQQIVTRHSEDFGNSPLTKVYSRGQTRNLFAPFQHVSLDCYRLDDYIPVRGRPFSVSRNILPSEDLPCRRKRGGLELDHPRHQAHVDLAVIPRKEIIERSRRYNHDENVGVHPFSGRISSWFTWIFVNLKMSANQVTQLCALVGFASALVLTPPPKTHSRAQSAGIASHAPTAPRFGRLGL
jgi:SAM-dependent methyltransferase